MSGIASEQRFSRHQPCPICGGWASMRPGQGQRCWGFRSTDGDYAHCTRLAGDLPPHHDGTYAHRLVGGCRCGQIHGQVLVTHHHAQSGTVNNTDYQMAALQLWTTSQPIPGTPAEAYLQRRGLRGPYPASLRSQRLLRHRSGSYHPALIAGVSVWPSTKVVAVHRTYLSTDGSKADVTPPKMALGPIHGGAVRLAPLEPKLVICEGLEDALTVQQATGWPAWAVLGTGNFGGLVLPDEVQEIVIAADNDAVGVRVARLARDLWRSQGKHVRLVLPPAEVKDFNQLLLRGAA